MFGRSWKKEALRQYDRGAELVDKHKVFETVDGVLPKGKSDTSSSTSSTQSDQGVKKRLILERRSSQPDDAAEKQQQYVIVLIVRFLTGVVLTQGMYLILTYQNQWNPKIAAMYTGMVGFVISVGIAFSVAVRSIVSLILPSMCTSKGRSIIMAFCLLQLMIGPSANIVYNYRELSSSLTCGDELGFNMTKGLSTLMQSNQNAILASMDDVIDAVIEAVEEAEQIFIELAQKVKKIGKVVKNLNEYLISMGDICEKRLGSFFCIVPNFVSKQARKFITRPIEDAIQTIKQEFRFKMSYKHEFVFEKNASKTSEQIAQDIMKEVKEKTGLAVNVFNWVKIVMSFSTALVFINAVKYSEFDNCYITKQFMEYDRKQARHGKVAALPLKAREITLYVRPGNIWMSRAELKKFAKGFSFLTFNFVYTLVVLLVDYALWRLLSFMTLSLSLKQQSRSLIQDLLNKGVSSVGSAFGVGEQATERLQSITGIAAQGVGFMTIIYRAIASGIEKIASAEGYEFRIDKCLPKARMPNFAVHSFLLNIYLVLYFVCFLEPYLLRIRRRIMSSYYPKREKVRILYLRGKILAKRGIGPGMFSLFKRACLNAQQNKEEQKVDFFARFAGRRGLIGIIARVLTGRTKYRCIVCRLAGGPKDFESFTRCATFGCSAIYCKDCYEELHRMCMVCLVKESKGLQKEKRLSKLGIETKGDVHHEIAELLVDSSGISDSSLSSSEEEKDPEQPSSRHSLLRPDNEEENELEFAKA